MTNAARRAIYTITIDGQDVTSNFEPHLLSLQIKLTDGGQSDTLDISLDDAGGRISMPREGAEIVATLAWSDGGGAVIFEGVTDEPESEGSRGQGMVLNITAHAADMKGKTKEKRQTHKDSAKFGDVANEWGKKADLDVRVSDRLASIQRDYWSMQNESFMAWGARMAQEMGATFKIMGKKAVFVPRNASASAGGKELPVVMADYGRNIIGWQIRPLQNRPRYNRSVVRWYDRKEAKWRKETVQLMDEAARAPLIDARKSGDKDRAKDRADSNAEEAKRGKGGGTVTLIGAPEAQAQGLCRISGVRPGVDGNYRVSEATHSLSRDGGWVTVCDLEQPNEHARDDI
jgi:phage protein D